MLTLQERRALTSLLLNSKSLAWVRTTNFDLRKSIEVGVFWMLLPCVLLTVVITGVCIYQLGRESLTFFNQVSLTEFLTGTRWEPLLEPKSFGVLPLVVGTFKIVLGAMLLALPMGILVAVYLSEYASTRMRNIVKPILELLAGIPTVVFGFFALTFVTPLLKVIYPETQIFNAAAGAIVVGLMILPLVSSLCDDAFSAVPRFLKEGAYALGATTFEVITQIIIPAAITRVGAATLLAISRAIGETMAVTLAAGATAGMTMHMSESTQTMTAFIVQVCMGDTPQGGIEYMSAFAVGTLLFIFTLSMNLLGNFLIFRDKEAK